MFSYKKLPKILVFLRHGESEANVYLDMVNRGEILSFPRELLKLRDWDIKLTEKGYYQALKTAEFLKKEFDNFDVVYVSPFLRARETFRVINQVFHFNEKKVIFDSRLREKDFGAINFLTEDEIKEFFPHEYARLEREGRMLYRPLGGESWYDMKDGRLRNFLFHLNENHSQEKVLVVTHFIVIYCLRMIFENLSETEVLNLIESNPFKNCGLAIFESDNKGLKLKEWNLVCY